LILKKKDNPKENQTEHEKEELSTVQSDVGVPISQEDGSVIYLEDITGRTSVSGNVHEEGDENKYVYKTAVAGTYRIDTDLSSGGEVYDNRSSDR
jgi:hypothetical protein